MHLRVATISALLRERAAMYEQKDRLLSELRRLRLSESPRRRAKLTRLHAINAATSTERTDGTMLQ